jgi:hypothetical protein
VVDVKGDAMAVKVIWGDRVHEAAVDEESVMLSEDTQVIVLSHAEMRELVIAWERHEKMEDEGK